MRNPVSTLSAFLCLVDRFESAAFAWTRHLHPVEKSLMCFTRVALDAMLRLVRPRDLVEKSLMCHAPVSLGAKAFRDLVLVCVFVWRVVVVVHANTPRTTQLRHFTTRTAIVLFTVAEQLREDCFRPNVQVNPSRMSSELLSIR